MTATITPGQQLSAAKRAWPTIRQLGLYESRMALKHRLSWVGALASVAIAAVELWSEEPVLNRTSVTLAWTMLPIAAAFALIAGGAVHRARGRTDAQPPMIMPLRMEERTAGVVLGVSLAGALVTIVVQLGLLGWLFTREFVTSLVWTELEIGPLYVMFAAALGAALARWISHPASGLITVLALIALVVAIPYRQNDWGRVIGPEWLLPMAWPQGVVPYEVTLRPAALHLAYLGGLAILLVATSVLGRWVPSWALLAIGVAIAVPAGLAQLGPISESRQDAVLERLVGDAAHLQCQDREQVTYCALAGYGRWIPFWIETAEPIVAAAPLGTTSDLEIRQYPTVSPLTAADISGIDQWWIGPTATDLGNRPRVVPVGVVWAEYSTHPLAHALARTIADCRVQCDGESQTFAFLWLAAHDPGIRSIVEGNVTGDTAPIADCMVADMWAHADGRALMHENWAMLVDHSTSYKEAGALLGIDVPAAIDEYPQIGEGCE